LSDLASGVPDVAVTLHRARRHPSGLTDCQTAIAAKLRTDWFFFVNSLVLRTDLGPAIPHFGTESSAEVGAGSLCPSGLTPGEACGGVAAQSRDPSRNPLFQVGSVSSLGNAPMQALQLPGLALNPGNLTGTTRFDLWSVRSEQGSLVGERLRDSTACGSEAAP